MFEILFLLFFVVIILAPPQTIHTEQRYFARWKQKRRQR